MKTHQINISTETLNGNFSDLTLFLPELLLVGIILLIVLLDLLIKDRKKAFFVSTNLFLFASLSLAVFGLFYSMQCKCSSLQHLFHVSKEVLSNGEILKSDPSIVNTKLGAFFKLLMGLSGILLVLFNQLEFKKNSLYEQKSEYYIALLSILLGASIMLGATHFLTLLIGIEISSFGAYALIFFNGDNKSKEASLKYILYGLMATGVMLFGMSLVFVEFGSLSYESVISQFDLKYYEINTDRNYSQAIWYNAGMLSGFISPMKAIGLLLFLAGFMFKLATVPMHLWVPDAFEGGSTSGIAFLSIVPKLGALGNVVLFFSDIYYFNIGFITIQELLMVLGVITLTVGNFFALGQNNIKRLLGYSSIAHSGFLLIALSVFGLSGLNSLLFYTLVYVFMNFGVFMLSEYFINRTGSVNIKAWAGVGAQLPFMSVLMVIVLIALIGLPPTAGFSAKLFVFTALIEQYSASSNSIVLWVLVIAAFNIIISLFYYLKIPFHLFFQKTQQSINDLNSVLPKLQLSLVVIPLVVLFLFSEKVLKLLQQINYIVNHFLQ